METMTLETLRGYLPDMEPEDATVINAALDAAIRERDELRSMLAFTKITAAEGARWMARAEKSEAEFAKLRQAIEGAIERDVIEGNAGAHGFHVVHTPPQWAGHRVLLVKCDD